MEEEIITQLGLILTQLRFTHEQVRYEPDYVRRILAQTASRLAISVK